MNTETHSNPKPHEFEHYYEYLRTRIRVRVEPTSEDGLYRITDYRRKRDIDTQWSHTVKEELGRTGTLEQLTPGRTNDDAPSSN